MNLDKRLFIRVMRYFRPEISSAHLLLWMESAHDQSIFTPKFAYQILSQWANCNPETEGDPFGLWDHCSDKMESEFCGNKDPIPFKDAALIR